MDRSCNALSSKLISVPLLCSFLPFVTLTYFILSSFSSHSQRILSSLSVHFQFILSSSSARSQHFLSTFSALSRHFLRTFSALSQYFLGTSFALTQHFHAKTKNPAIIAALCIYYSASAGKSLPTDKIEQISSNTSDQQQSDVFSSGIL